MTKEEFLILLEKYLNGKATPQEIKFLEAYYEIYNAGVDPIFTDKEQLKNSIKSVIDDQILQASTKPKTINIWSRYASAAAVVLLITGVFFFFQNSRRKDQLSLVATHLPGSNKAILTLANGKQISLTDIKNGLINQQKNVKVYKSKNGQLIYTSNSPDDQLANNVHPSKIQWNTVTTPRGGQWQVILPDGTKVWLNSASRLKYPEHFAGNVREVVLQGEAYFEVFHNKKMPFHVTTNDQDVEVLGTHFNINSYKDEPFSTTTLLEGSVKITQFAGNRTAYLKPDQEASLFPDRIKTVDVDAEDAIAWKEGIFLFQDDTLDEIMKEISRWYDIDVEFKDESLKTEMFSGTVSRFAQISEVLSKLEKLGGVSFKMGVNKIIVMK